MISASTGYKNAIVGDVRRILIQSIIEIIDPDIVYGTAQAQTEASFSLSNQLHDKVFELTRYATLERNRWLLDGTFQIIPDNNSEITGQMGYVSGDLSGDDGTFENAQWVEMQFSNVSILQACSLYFPTESFDGVPANFTVEVKQGGTAYFTKSFTDNTSNSISLSGFTVQNPDAIRVTVTKWSLPGRRMRVCDIVPGIYEKWDGDTIAEFTMKHQGDVSCIMLPYGTCTIKMDNIDRRFEPRSKDGLFQSIEERQGIPVSVGTELEDGTVEYKQVGVFYQYSGGWKTGDNGLTMQWDLVDIVGLLADREFIPPDTLPTTLEGWMAALVAQLGVNFEGLYTVDPDYAQTSLTVRQQSDVVGIKCGDLLRYVCMATGTWPRADAETGNLTAEPLWSQGNKVTLDNLTNYPTIKANDDIAAIVFTINDGNDTQYVVSGNSTASSETKSISNPFIQTKEQCLTAARMILSTYGGNKYELTGRGDPSTEIGDVETLELDESTATTGRVIQQDLSFSGGVMQNCTSVLLQADGSFLFQEKEIITTSGTWTAPANVKNNQLRIILGQAGQGGTVGKSGTFEADGEKGEDGVGGKVFTATININPGQSFEVNIGVGSNNGSEGGETTFGQYSSANGERYSPSYTDVQSGDAYARSGVKNPIGNGDGSAGGEGGEMGKRHRSSYVDSSGNEHGFWVVDKEPGFGKPAAKGGDGFVVVYWDKEDA